MTCRPLRLIASLMLVAACSSSENSAPTEPTDVTGAATDVPTVDTTATGGDGAAAATDAVGLPDTPDGPELPPRICRSSSAWAPGTAAFTDVTADSGLVELGVTGMRVSAADVDGDGLAEVSIRNYKPGERDDFGPEGKRFTWLLHNDGGLRFSDMTQDSGFLRTKDGGDGRTCMIVVFGDVDNDGDVDAFSGVNSSDQTKDNGDRTEILLNDGAGNFTLAPGGDVRHPGTPTATAAASFADINQDGRLDLWVGYDVVGSNVQPDLVYLGDGAGGFEEYSAQFGVTTDPWTTVAAINSATVHRRSWGTTVCDVSGDGRPDLLSSSYSRYFNGMWISKPDGTYFDHTLGSGAGSDPNNDWTTNMNAQCFCQLNPSAPDCANVPGPPDFFPCAPGQQLRWNHDFDREPFRLGGNTFSTACGDVDNDGDMDLMTFEIVHWDVGSSSDPSQLFINQGGDPPTFVAPGGAATGIEREWERIDWNEGDINGDFLDFDNDGRLDIYIASSDYPGTRGFLFHQKPDGTFEEVSTADGIDHPRSLGVSIADFDGDGDLDIISGHGRARCSGDPTCYPSAEVHVFRNDIGAAGNWLQVQLVGGQNTNRSAIGARVRVTAGGVTQTREVGGGHGHYGQQNDLALHFGLGDACDVDKVEVRWPNAAGTTEVFEQVRANYRIRIQQGQGVSYDD